MSSVLLASPEYNKLIESSSLGLLLVAPYFCNLVWLAIVWFLGFDGSQIMFDCSVFALSLHES